MRISSWSGIRDLVGRFSGLLVVCVAGFLILLLGGVLPSARNTQAMRAEIAELRAELQKKEALAPVYTMLQQQASRTLPDSLILPERRPLPLNELPAVSALLRAMAADTGLELIAANPQFQNFKERRDSLRVDARLRGDFLNMRDFLLRLGALPQMERLESISVLALDAGRELRISIWLKIK